MLNWLKQRIFGTRENWMRAQQAPGVIFPFPKGAKLKPEEEVILAFPEAVVQGEETIGSVILCDDNAELSLNSKLEVWYVKLKPGMIFSLAKSCDVMVISADSRPRFFQIMMPNKKITERSAAQKTVGPTSPPATNEGAAKAQ